MEKIANKYTFIFGIPKDDAYDTLKSENILFCEMRPNLTGAKILSEKLKKNKIKTTMISDNSLGHLFFLNKIKKVCLFSLPDNTFAPGAQLIKILADWHNVPVETSVGAPIKIDLLVDKNAATFLGKRVATRKIKVITPKNESLNLN